jgi:hypothetical protein
MKLERTTFGKRMSTYAAAINLPRQPVLEGRLLRMVGLTLEAEGLRAAMGSRCIVINDDGYDAGSVEAEVMGFSGSKVYLMPVGSVSGIAPGARVVPLADTGRLPMGMTMLGRVLDGAGRALDGKGGMKAEDWVPMDGPTINPLKRDPISTPLDVGIRCINGLLTVGRGQRLGLFAGTGVGKSVLLGMMTRFTEADIIVVGLIGERGREVKEFIEHSLGTEGLKRSVVVASPADDAPLMRLRAAMYCTRIAEYFRDKGKNVLLLMDSLTRNRPGHRRTAGDQGLSALGIRQAAQAGRTRRQRRGRWRLDHRFLHRALRRRRPAGPDRRLGARRARRPHRAVPTPGGGGALPGHRHRSLDQPGDAFGGQPAAPGPGPAIQADVVALSAKPRPDQRRCLRARRRSRYRPGDFVAAGDGALPAPGPQ